MKNVKEIQGILLRYFAFGNSQEEARVKVKSFSEDCTFIGIPIREYADKMVLKREVFYSILAFSDMGFIRQLRGHIEDIKKSQEEAKPENPIDKSQFQKQYLDFLTTKSRSIEKSKMQLKQLAEDMNWIGCPIGEHIDGLVRESSKLTSLQAMSTMNIISKMREFSEEIKK